jgi:hypothetical protein
MSILRAAAAVPWWIWAVTAIAFLLRVAAIGYGLPYELDPDEVVFVDSALAMVVNGRFDPSWYGHPGATLLDPLAGLYALYGLGGDLLGAFDSVTTVEDLYHADVSHLFLVGRFLTILVGVGVVVLTYAVSRALRISSFWSAVAMLLVAVSFPMIQYSAIVRTDMFMIFFLLGILLAMVRALDRPSARLFLVAGILLGLAVTSKYPGALGVLPIIVANATLVVGHVVTPRKGLIWLGGAAIAGLATAFMVAPYLFLDWRRTLTAIRSESNFAPLDGLGTGPVGNWWAYVADALPWALGITMTVLAALGLILMLGDRRARMVSVTFWGYLVFIASRGSWWLRWALPLVPLAAIGAAWLVDRADGRLAARVTPRWLRFGRIVVACLLVLPIAVPTLGLVRSLAVTDDSRLRAIEWLEQEVPPGSTLLIDIFTTPVRVDRYDVRIGLLDSLVRWQDLSPKLRPTGFGSIGETWADTPDSLLRAIDREGVDLIVLSGLFVDLLRAEATRFPEMHAVYEALLAAYPVVRTFDADDAPLGYPVLVLDPSATRPAD